MAEHNGWKRAAVIFGVLIPLTGVTITAMVQAFRAGGDVATVQMKLGQHDEWDNRQDGEIAANEHDITSLQQQSTRLDTNQQTIMRKLDRQDDKLDQILREMREQ